MNRRLLSFGGSAVAIDYETGRPAELVNFLFQNIPPSLPADPWTTLRLRTTAGPDRLSLWQEDVLLARDESPASMAHTLMSQVCFTLAYDSRGGLLLHAAAVMCGAQGVILPGKTGAGKSTLTAWLLHHGGRYLTDELVYLPTGSDHMRGFGRPLTIKPPALRLLPELLIQGHDPNAVMAADPANMILPEAFGCQAWLPEATPNLMVFPRYRADGRTEVRRLSRANAAFELMRCLANARNLPEHGLPQAKRLASAISAYSLDFSDLHDAGRAILDLMS